jgi:hypothetical protein
MAPQKREITTALPTSSHSSAELERIVNELREANERLVLTGVQLHEMTEKAETRRLEAEAATAEAEMLRQLGISVKNSITRRSYNGLSMKRSRCAGRTSARSSSRLKAHPAMHSVFLRCLAFRKKHSPDFRCWRRLGHLKKERLVSGISERIHASTLWSRRQKIISRSSAFCLFQLFRRRARFSVVFSLVIVSRINLHRGMNTSSLQSPDWLASRSLMRNSMSRCRKRIRLRMNF